MKWSGAVEGCRACARELLGSLGCEKIGMRKSEISVLTEGGSTSQPQLCCMGQGQILFFFFFFSAESQSTAAF